MQTRHRVLIALAAGMLLGLSASTPWAESAGRTYSRCINACNSTRQACSAACPDSCKSMFPNDVQAKNACLSACKEACVRSEKECKDRCQAIKNGESPSEP